MDYDSSNIRPRRRGLSDPPPIGPLLGGRPPTPPEPPKNPVGNIGNLLAGRPPSATPQPTPPVPRPPLLTGRAYDDPEPGVVATVRRPSGAVPFETTPNDPVTATPRRETGINVTTTQPGDEVPLTTTPRPRFVDPLVGTPIPATPSGDFPNLTPQTPRPQVPFIPIDPTNIPMPEAPQGPLLVPKAGPVPTPTIPRPSPLPEPVPMYIPVPQSPPAQQQAPYTPPYAQPFAPSAPLPVLTCPPGTEYDRDLKSCVPIAAQRAAQEPARSAPSTQCWPRLAPSCNSDCGCGCDDSLADRRVAPRRRSLRFGFA